MLHERTGSLVSAILVLAAFAVVTLLCAVFFPDRPEELHPELWALRGWRTGAGGRGIGFYFPARRATWGA